MNLMECSIASVYELHCIALIQRAQRVQAPHRNLTWKQCINMLVRLQKKKSTKPNGSVSHSKYVLFRVNVLQFRDLSMAFREKIHSSATSPLTIHYATFVI